MTDLFVALALILVIEGALYALFPDGMKRMMVYAMETSSATLRTAGLAAAIAGVLLIWLIRV